MPVLAAWLVATELSACEPQSAQLVVLTGVQRDDDNDLLFVRGQGFPAGHLGRATIAGTLYEPFGARSALTLSARCRADSSDSLVIDMSTIREARGGLLEGTLEVSFAAAAGDGTRIAGRLRDARVRLRERDLKRTLRADRGAREFLDEIGVGQLEPVARGLLVAELRDDGLAAQAGLARSDVLVRLDGAPLERPSDLTPRGAGGDVEIVARRRGVERIVRVPRAQSVATTVDHTLTWLVFAITLLGVSFLPAPRSTPPPKLGAKALGAGAALALVSSLPALFAGVSLGWSYLLPASSVIGAMALDFIRRRTTAMAFVRGVLAIAALTVSLSTFVVLTGSASLMLQGAPTSPLLSWPLLAAPPAWLAWIVLCDALRSHAPSSQTGRMVASWLSWTVALCIASLGLGGAHAATGATALIILATKSALVMLALRAARDPARFQYTRALSVLCPLAAAGWLMLPQSAPPSELMASACVGGMLAVVGRRIASKLSARGPIASDPQLEPFR